MNQNLKDILAHLSTEVKQETLLLYLQGKLSPEEQHEVEKHLLTDDFEDEALEGLNEVKNKSDLALLVAQLNNDLKKKTKASKGSKKNHLKEDQWLWMAILIILLLVIVSYIIIHQQLQRG